MARPQRPRLRQRRHAPYLPFIEALRRYIHTCTPESLAAQLGSGAAAIARLVPDVRAMLPDLSEAPSGTPAGDRYHLFECVTSFLRSVARDRALDGASARRDAPGAGLVLILDDLHWADHATLLLLMHLARSLDAVSLLVLGAHRPLPSERNDALAALIDTLHRERLLVRLTLTPLAAGESAALVTAIAGGGVAPETAAAIYRQAAGNPFFTEEIVRHLCAGGHGLTPAETSAGELAIPDGVRQAIARRLRRLTAPAQRLTEAASVLGDGFDFESLTRMDEHDVRASIAALEETLSAGILQEREERYHFSHPLIRRTLYDSLSLPRRQRLHLAAAEAIEQAHARDLAPHLAALATHFRLAGPAADPARTVEYARRAAEAAATLFAWSEAAGHFQTALDHAPAGDPALCCDLVLDFGNAIVNAGQNRRVIEELAPRAYEIARQLQDRRRMWRACWLALTGLRNAGAMTAALSLEFRRWAELAGEYAEPGTRERVVADQFLAAVRAEEGDVGGAAALRRHALELARTIDDRVSLSAAIHGVVQLPALPSTIAYCFQVAGELLADALTSTVPSGSLTSVVRAGEIVLDWGQRDRTEAAWQLAARVLKRATTAVGELHVLMIEPRRAMLDGRLEDVVAGADRLLARAEELESAGLGRQYGRAIAFRPLLYLGRADEALAWHRRVVDISGRGDAAAPQQQHWVILAGAYLGRTAAAREQLRRLLERCDVGHNEDAIYVYQLVHLLEAAVLIGDEEATTLLASRLRALAHLRIGDSAYTCVARHLGAAASLAGDHDAARGYFEQALVLSQQIRFRPEAALARLDLAQVLLARFKDERAAALDHLNTAKTELEAMGMRPALEQARALLERSRGRARAARDHPDGLSEREVEVLRLVAAGRTNRAIAAELVISVNTVFHHLSNIYAKTGAANRAEAAAFATRNGLAD